jgi:hypothetical protein
LKYSQKRKPDETLDAAQAGNQAWWTDHTMLHHWGESVQLEKFLRLWFDEIDRRFIRDSRLYGHDRQPFDRILPFKRLEGGRALEIGCGTQPIDGRCRSQCLDDRFVADIARGVAESFFLICSLCVCVSFSAGAIT